jgi:hypothetical protein
VRLVDLQEGMGGSSGGGTAGSAGAGGSSLGLPYPSTYEEENDKFKHFHPVNKNKRPMHNLSMTTEEQQEMFTDHDVMQLLMKDKAWPADLQTEVLRKYAGRPQEGEIFIDSVKNYPTTVYYKIQRTCLSWQDCLRLLSILLMTHGSCN